MILAYLKINSIDEAPHLDFKMSNVTLSNLLQPTELENLSLGK